MILYNPTVSGSLVVTGSLTTTGTITSQTLVVQTITSSIEFNTGSTRNGTLSTNTHEFTGSVNITGSAAALLNVNNGVLYVSASGNVGIGTISPTAKLEIASATFQDHLILNRTGIGLMHITATNPRGLAVTDGTSQFFTIIQSTGNVGIGTTSPSARLHTEVAVEGTGTGAVALIAKTSNGVNDIFRWFDGSTQLGVFKNNGNVGIKTTSPEAALHVVGNQFIAKSGGGGTYKQTVVGQTTAAASGVAKTVAYIGHTNSIRIYVWATQSASSGMTAIKDITTTYGSSAGGNAISSGTMGNVSGINIAYDNSGYVLTISVTYSGTAPTINYVIEGINNGNDIYTI